MQTNRTKCYEVIRLEDALQIILKVHLLMEVAIFAEEPS